MSEQEALTVSVTNSAGDLGADKLLVLPVFAGEDAGSLPETPGFDRAAIDAALAGGRIRSGRYESAIFHGASGPSLLFIGAGSREDMEPILMLRLSAAAARHAARHGFRHLAFHQVQTVEPKIWAHAVVEGAIRGPYNPGLKKSTGQDETRIEALTLISGADRGDLEAGARIGTAAGEASTIARDLVNLPPNELTPSAFAQQASTLAAEEGLGCEVMGEEGMRDLGMGSFLGVSMGSDEPAQFITLRYGPEDAALRLALVGKGLTFDSGGLSLKTAEGMETMKGDMGGGAAVVAGMLAIARLAPAGIAVTGYVGATENMPSGKSMRPGDVLTAMNGKTIEVLNTDAEGRLVLADVLSYACRQGATHVVDFATLTGGAMVALGRDATLAAGKPLSWVQRVVAAAETGLERAWAMPLYEEYRRAMDSDVADIKNSGGRYGSALTATAFLSEFVEDVPWAHMDIAGTSWASTATPYRATGGTGAGVGTIVALALELAHQSEE